MAFILKRETQANGIFKIKSQIKNLTLTWQKEQKQTKRISYNFLKSCHLFYNYTESSFQHQIPLFLLKKIIKDIHMCNIQRISSIWTSIIFFFLVSVMAWKDSTAKILWIPTKNYWKNPLHLNTPTRYSYEKSKNKLLFKFALFNQSIYAYFYIFFLTKLKYFLKDMTNSFYVLTNALFFM